MKIYFDIEHLKSLLKSILSHPERDVFLKILKARLNIKCTFDKSFPQSNLKRKDIDLIRTFLMQLTTGRGNTDSIEYTIELPKLMLHSGQNQKQPLANGFSDVYMLSDFYVTLPDNQAIPAHQILLMPSEQINELKVLENLLIENRELIGSYLSQSMDDWSVIEENKSPCTDIILVDKYVFSDNEANIDINLHSILNILCSSAVVPTNIVIFSNGNELVLESRIGNNNVIKNIKEYLKNKTGVVPYVTFVKCDSLQGDLKRVVHDRQIITNYKRFKSGDSFTYFGGKTKPDTELEIYSLCHSNHFNVTNQKIQGLQDVVDYLKNKPQIQSEIIGDKKSNYLIF